MDAYMERLKGRRPEGTKTWVAEQLRIDRTTLYKYLDGTNRLPLDTLHELARLLGLDEDEANTLLFLGGYAVAVQVVAAPPPVEPAITPADLRAALTEALAEALPGAVGDALTDQLSLLSGLLSDISKGQISREDLSQVLADDQRLDELIHTLAGRQVASGDTLIDFGSAQAGDITIGNVAGRDQITLNVYIHGGAMPVPPTLAPAAPGICAAPNPFGRRGRIEDPAEFFGREELLRRIFEELAKGSNLSLIGERQVGKSSLLAAIQRQGAERLELSPAAILSIDMQLIHSEADFFDALCGELGLDQAYRGYHLKRRLQGKRHILCLDEIEKMRRDRFTADVRDELRGLSDGVGAPLTLVIASSLPLAELFPDKQGEVSPLDNICSPLDVPPFSRAEARAFLEDRLRNTGVAFDADEIAELLEQSGRHPGRLQQLAADLYRRKAGG
jgi:hypothetical protein